MLIADLCVWGVWLPQAEALFDICIIDTDAQSYLGRSPTQVISVAENEERKYLDAAAACRAHFTHLCFSVDGDAGSQAASFLKILAYCYLLVGRGHMLI